MFEFFWLANELEYECFSVTALTKEFVSVTFNDASGVVFCWAKA